MPFSRRMFLAGLAAAPATARLATPTRPYLGELREDIVTSPVAVAHHRARVYTDVFRANEKKPWIVRKGKALREYFNSVSLYIRPHDRIAGSISETPGAMPLFVELGIGENGIYTGENPGRRGYLTGQVPPEIWDYWYERNLWGQFRALHPDSPNAKPPAGPESLASYKFISNQGHLSPAYSELLEIGIDGYLEKIRGRRRGERDPDSLAFLESAEDSMAGLSEWIGRYAAFLLAEAGRAADAHRANDLKEMARIGRKVATEPPETFREALQLIWFAHQTIHIEGHGYSCTPDHLDQILLPFYESDKKAGRIDDEEVVALTENFVLKQYDNTFWGPEHHLTQGFVVGGSTPDGKDLSNRLSWLMLTGATNMVLPEPLVWVRWNRNIDQKFFDYCLTRVGKTTSMPMFWSDEVVPAGLVKLGVSEKDAYNYLPVGCNELAIPGQFYFNPGANCGYLGALEATLTAGKGYKGNRKPSSFARPLSELATFDDFVSVFGGHLRESVASSYRNTMTLMDAQMRWGQTPLTSCLFDGCIERGRDMVDGTKYNILSCGGVFFPNAVDALGAIRKVVYQDGAATLDDVAAACRNNYKGYETLRAKLLAAPKHGNDDPYLDDIIALVERLRDKPMKEICKDPRDGTPMGNGHVVRSSSVRTGLVTPATPDGRLAGTPLASSVAAGAGCEKSGPTALLNSVCKLNGPESWQTGYQVNIRFTGGMLKNNVNRMKVRAMLNVYFREGGQELQINCVDTEVLLAAQKDPEAFRDLVVRVAGFSEFFVNLRPEIQADIIAREAHT